MDLKALQREAHAIASQLYEDIVQLKMPGSDGKDMAKRR